MVMTEMMMIVVTLVAVGLALASFRRGKLAENEQDFAELRGQLSQITTQSQELQRLIAEQMAQSEGRLSNRLEESLRDQGERTTKSLTGMAEKLAVITEANTHISALSSQVTQLQNVLSNKQARGSFGEVQLENLVRDALPDSAYDFQVTLTNGRRVDCFLKLPNPPGPIAIDSKFPLESYRQLVAVSDDAAKDVAHGVGEGDVKAQVVGGGIRDVVYSEKVGGGVGHDLNRGQLLPERAHDANLLKPIISGDRVKLTLGVSTGSRGDVEV